MIDQERFFRLGGYNPKVVSDGVVSTLRDGYLLKELLLSGKSFFEGVDRE